jgi:hypothetical protein
MFPATRNRASRTSQAFILVLVACLFVFAIYLKVAPNLKSNFLPTTSAQTKIWIDPSDGQDTRIKLASLAGFCLFFLVLIAVYYRSQTGQAVLTPVFLARDLFTGSRHWFRPPPLF